MPLCEDPKAKALSNCGELKLIKIADLPSETQVSGIEGIEVHSQGDSQACAVFAFAHLYEYYFDNVTDDFILDSYDRIRLFSGRAAELSLHDVFAWALHYNLIDDSHVYCPRQIELVKAALAGKDGYKPRPIAITLKVFANKSLVQEIMHDGKWVLPEKEMEPYGNHALLLYGYTDQYFIGIDSASVAGVRNGRVYVPFDYLEKYGVQAMGLKPVKKDRKSEKLWHLMWTGVSMPASSKGATETWLSTGGLRKSFLKKRIESGKMNDYFPVSEDGKKWYNAKDKIRLDLDKIPLPTPPKRTS